MDFGLEKDKEKRYQSSKELAEHLRNVSEVYAKEDLMRIDKIKKKLLPKLRPGPRTKKPPSGSVKIPKASRKVYLAGLVIFLLLSAIVYYFLFTQQPFEVNPEMKIHELVTPFTDISNPSISADGNWIAFSGCDQNGKWDIYLMHSRTGESRRITHDSTSFIRFAGISPEGSQILYTIFNKQELYKVSSVTGNKKKLADSVNFAAWRPDGKQIGYLVERYPKLLLHSFWTMNPDGSNKHYEFCDKGQGWSNISFSYSPDGKSVAWLRQYYGGYGEIFTKELGSGKEKQLTFDKKSISDLYWTKKGVILFLSAKSGNMNTYMIKETGGREVQITKGTGPDVEVTASWDLSKILTFQSVNYSNTYVENLITSESKQITFDERLIVYPSISPDGVLIAYSQYNAFAEWSHVAEIFVMDRKGNQLRQLTSDKAVNIYVLFSPDGKYIAYTQLHEFPHDEIGKVFIIKPDGSDRPKFITNGRAWMWADNNSPVVSKNIYYKLPSETEIVSIDGTQKKIILKDSALAFPAASGKLIFYIDLHHDNFMKAYRIPSDYIKNSPNNFPHYLFSLKDIFPLHNGILQIQINQDYFYWLSDKWFIWRLNYLSGKKEMIGYFPGIMHYFGYGFGINKDDNELIYLSSMRRSKMLLIENAIIGE